MRLKRARAVGARAALAHFNTKKVRLKLSCGAQAHDLYEHFNTKKVRLKPRGLEPTRARLRHFNTKKVRLKPNLSYETARKVLWEFQYQKGAIKTILSRGRVT